VGAYHADPSGRSSAGKSYVVFGKQSTNIIELSDIAAGKGGFVINGKTVGDYSGHSVSSAGDVNGDGLDDLIVGAYNTNPKDKSHAGESYVVFGKKDNTNAIELSSIIGANGFLIKGESGNVWSNHLVSSAGDVNGDGLDDLIISAHDDKSYVVFGKQGTNAINLPAIAAGTSTDGFVINGKSGNDHKGYLISNAGDVNGDGLDDLIIGAYVANPKGQGKSYVVFGKQDNTAINLSDIVAGTGGFVSHLCRQQQWLIIQWHWYCLFCHFVVLVFPQNL
jgi:hypothetical protein